MNRDELVRDNMISDEHITEMVWIGHMSSLELLGKVPQTIWCLLPGIGVGRGPSGPSIEGPFCCAVHLCRTLGNNKKKIKKNAEILCIFYAFLSFYY